MSRKMLKQLQGTGRKDNKNQDKDEDVDEDKISACVARPLSLNGQKHDHYNNSEFPFKRINNKDNVAERKQKAETRKPSPNVQ